MSKEQPKKPVHYCGKQDLSTTVKKCLIQCKECKKWSNFAKL